MTATKSGETDSPNSKGTKSLPPLPRADQFSTIVTRFAPNPDFVLHLGSVRAIILSHDYAQMYKGKFLVRFEDTDPRLKKSVLQYYDLILEDLRWLECPWDQEFIQSDRVQIYYDHASQLLGQGAIYVCRCSPENFRLRVSQGQPCPDRGRGPEENLEDWSRMLEGKLPEGSAVVRVKTNLSHPNPAVRDWPALRIIDPVAYPHPRVGSKYWVWPLYNFSAAIDDHLTGVTHIIRGKEHETNMLRQEYMYKALGWQYPVAIHYGRLKTVGIKLSKSIMVKEVEEGLVEGYADPRLATLAALRRRGYVPATFRRIVYELGPRPVDATLSWENLDSANRKEIDQIAKRFTFIGHPVELEVSGVETGFESHQPLHPGKPGLGVRILQVEPEDGIARLWLSASDVDLLSRSKVVRLMELFNIEMETAGEKLVKARFHSQDYLKAKELKSPLVQWLPKGQEIACEVVMPDATKTIGFAEPALRSEPVGTILQMVRVGFGRIDKTEPKLMIYFGHR